MHCSVWQLKPTWVLALSQDVFSMGCVLAELFLDGKELFNLSQVMRQGGTSACACQPCLHHRDLHRACGPRTHVARLQGKSSCCCCGSRRLCARAASPGANLSLHCLLPRQAAAVVQLLAFRRGEHSPEPALAAVDAPFRELVLHMTQLDPGAPTRAWGRGLQLCEGTANTAQLSPAPAQAGPASTRNCADQSQPGCSSAAACRQDKAHALAHTPVVSRTHWALPVRHQSWRERAGKRLRAAEYAAQWGPRLFPAYFGASLHGFFCSLLPMDADERAAATLAAFPALLRVMQPRPAPEPRAPGSGGADGTDSATRGGGADDGRRGGGERAGGAGEGPTADGLAKLKVGGAHGGGARGGGGAVDEWAGLAGGGDSCYSAGGGAVPHRSGAPPQVSCLPWRGGSMPLSKSGLQLQRICGMIVSAKTENPFCSLPRWTQSRSGQRSGRATACQSRRDRTLDRGPAEAQRACQGRRLSRRPYPQP